MGMRLCEKLIAVAGGQRTKSELAGLGDEDFAPWQMGATFWNLLGPSFSP